MNTIIAKTLVAIFSNRPKPLMHYLKRHFSSDPRKFPIVTTQFGDYRHACVCLAIQNYLTGKHRHATILGTSITDSDANFGDLMHPDSFEQQTTGPIQYVDVALSNGANLSCARQVIYLVRDNGQRFAIFLKRPRHDEQVTVEILSPDRRRAEQFLSELRKLADEHSIYRGHVLSIKESDDRDITVSFHSVPTVDRHQLILAKDVIEEIDRHTSRVSDYRELLIARGRHLKRGLLLYGPPGTGKSLTLTYLLGKMRGRTTILLTGTGVQYLEDACDLARALEPATIVIDDADLIAEERTRRHHNPLLFELLNQMDGIADDADILFLLTTNRPDELEPAISSRPGRIDQAILIPLPDLECRARLFELYSQKLPFAVQDMPKFIAITAGVSGAFIRELLRKAAVLALEEGVEVPIQDSHMDAALRIMQAGGSLTARILGCSEDTTDVEEVDDFLS